MKTEIDVVHEIVSNLCTYEMAEKIQKAGITADNVKFLVFDELKKPTQGEIGVKLDKKYRPCISYPIAISMFKDIDKLDVDRMGDFHLEDDIYYLSFYEKNVELPLLFKSKNKVDCFLEAWLHFNSNSK